MYERLPSSLKSELQVRVRHENPEVQRERAELVRSKSPAELAQMTSISDFPLPSTIEQYVRPTSRPGAVERKKRFREKHRSLSAKNLYDSMPRSLKSELLVKSKFEDPEVQKQRAALVGSKSVSELSQVTSFSDFPVPGTIERMVAKAKATPSDGNEKKSNLNLASLSTKDLYATLPKSLKSEVLVRSRVEDPEVRQKRMELTQSKSVSELSQVKSFSDFPIPSNIEKLIHHAKSTNKEGENQGFLSGVSSPAQLEKNLYETLPRSLKSEVLVRSRVESPEVLVERRNVVQSKSVHELSQVTSLADVPIPSPIQKLVDRAQGKVDHSEGSSGKGLPSLGKMEDIYASLPRSLKKEVMVRSKVEEDEEELKRRQNLVETKTPAELSQIHSFSEVPLPRRVEAWLHSSEQQPQKPSRSLHELREGLYDTLPKSLKDPILVSTVREDPEVQRARYEITRAKTPSQLAEINDIHDIPLPGLWTEREGSAKKPGSSTLPKNTQEFKELVYNSVFPESMTKPCVVRSRVEDPNTLRERQELQQRKSIHELSKIRNLNEFPLPVKVKLPDIPLPSAKGLLKVIARTPNNGKKSPKNASAPDYTPASTPACEPITDDEMLRFEASTPGGDLQHRDQDFGYEVIDGHVEKDQEHVVVVEVAASAAAAAEEEEPSNIADQYRGTPPLKSKKKMHRPSPAHTVPTPEQQQVQLSDELPPPLPPKRPSSARRESPAVAAKVSHSGSSQRVEDFHSCADDVSIERIQNRPLPAAPPSASNIQKSGSFGSAREQFHSIASTLDRTLVDSAAGSGGGRLADDETLAESIIDSMHSCADTLQTAGEDDATLHSCADTLADAEDDDGSVRDCFDSPTPPASIGK